MRNLLRAIGRLAGWQKLVIVAMLVLIALTWLAICLVLTGYLSP